MHALGDWGRQVAPPGKLEEELGRFPGKIAGSVERRLEHNARLVSAPEAVFLTPRLRFAGDDKSKLGGLMPPWHRMAGLDFDWRRPQPERARTRGCLPSALNNLVGMCVEH